jgi:hypothetical protein
MFDSVFFYRLLPRLKAIDFELFNVMKSGSVFMQFLSENIIILVDPRQENVAFHFGFVVQDGLLN